MRICRGKARANGWRFRGYHLQRQEGFSLIEVLVAGFVLVVGLIFIATFFSSAIARVLDSDVRSVLDQVASEEIEMVRGLPYDDVGTADGHPSGVLAPTEERTVNKVLVRVDRAVIFWTDPSYTGPYPANYRRVTVTATAVDYPRLGPVEITSNVAGGATGGTLDIRVLNAAGSPVADALITVTNTNLMPNVNITSAAMRTDVQGHLLVPGLPPDDSGGYVVSATKAGCNTAVSDPEVVQDGTPYTPVTLYVDQLCTLRTKVVDTTGVIVPGLRILVTGPWDFERELVSTDDWLTLSDLAFSLDQDPYVVLLEPNQGYDPVSAEVILDAGATEEVVLTVLAAGSTTTTTGSTSTTGTTTTTSPQEITLTVHVVNAANGQPINSARVQVGGENKRTNSQGDVVFGPMEAGTYTIVVRRNNYWDYRQNVLVVGPTYLEVRLVRN